MNATNIEWVKNPDNETQGMTWNPIAGCLGPKGDGVRCPYCYANKLARGRLTQRYLANPYVAPRFEEDGTRFNWYEDVHDPFYPRFWSERLHQPERIKKPTGIFTVDMGELFGNSIPREWQEQIFDVIRACPQHRFYLLTHQPQNLIQFSPFPDNCFVGVTATNLEEYRAAIVGLVAIKAKVKYISFEPLLKKIPMMPPYSFPYDDISWVILGAQTKPYKPPSILWVNEIVKAADQAGIPVFLKNNLWALVLADGLWEKRFLNQQGELRQELPKKASMAKCYICGKEASHIDQHHIDCKYGAISKETVPLCRRCHRTYHDLGVEWFDSEYLDKAIEIENRRRKITYAALKDPVIPLHLLTREDIKRSDYWNKIHGARLVRPGITPLCGWDWLREHENDNHPEQEIEIKFDDKVIAKMTASARRGAIRKTMREKLEIEERVNDGITKNSGGK